MVNPMDIWLQLVNEPWGRATVAAAAFLFWCAAGLVLAGRVRQWLRRARLRWDGSAYLEERLRWFLPVWVGLSGAAVSLKVAQALHEHVAVSALATILLALLVVSIGATITEAAFRLLGGELRRDNVPDPLVRFAQVTAALTTSFLTLLFLLAVVDVAVTPLFALGGLVLVPVFLFFQDSLANLVGYYRLTRARRLKVGDLVQLENGVRGHVADITWQDVRIRTIANNLMAVPNRRLTQLIVTNYHQPEPSTLSSMPVLVDGAADPTVAEAVIMDELQRAAGDVPGLAGERDLAVRRDPARKDAGTGFMLFYRLTDADFREGVEREILQRLARRFHEEDIGSPLRDLVRSADLSEVSSTSARELQLLVKERLSDTLFVVASNREPYLHNFDGASIRWTTPVSGMTTALDPVMTVLGGLWVAHGSGTADREVTDERGRVQVPPDSPSYTVRRLWLSREQEAGYYYGFSNQALWPLCHVAYVRPRFEAAHWQVYKEVNELFAQAIIEEIQGRQAFVFLQDYHLALVPRFLREAGVRATIAHFWHIPWPNSEVFRTCPWGGELLDGLLGNDLLGFHLRQYCNNFLRCVDQALESRVDHDRTTVTRHGQETLVRAFPIGVDYAAITGGTSSPPVQRLRDQFRRDLGLEDCRVGLGVDRLDYTKGIPERLRALDFLFTKHPSYCGRFTFVQVGVPSRSQIPEYESVDDEVQHLVDQVNWRHQRGSWKPIVYLRRQFDAKALWALYGLADVCVVSSLHDGMNLVAKEYVASRVDNTGVLVLSKFAGAATELTDALEINPYDAESFAAALQHALEMPLAEQERRMTRMRALVGENDIYRWAGRLLSQFWRLEAPTPAASRASWG